MNGYIYTGISRGSVDVAQTAAQLVCTNVYVCVMLFSVHNFYNILFFLSPLFLCPVKSHTRTTNTKNNKAQKTHFPKFVVHHRTQVQVVNKCIWWNGIANNNSIALNSERMQSPTHKTNTVQSPREKTIIPDEVRV